MSTRNKKLLVTIVTVVLIALCAIVFIWQFGKKKELEALRTNVYNGVQESTKMYAEGYVGVIKNLHQEDTAAMADSVANAASSHVVVGELKRTDLDIMVDSAKAALGDKIAERNLELNQNEETLLYDGIEAIVIETVGKTYADKDKMGQDTTDYLTQNLTRRLNSITIVMNEQTDDIYTDVVALEQLIATLKSNTADNSDIVFALQQEMLALQAQLNEVNVDNKTVDGQNTAIFAALKSIQDKIKALGAGYDKSLDNLSKEIDEILKNGAGSGTISQSDITKIQKSLNTSTDSLKKTVSQHTTQISTLNDNLSQTQTGVDNNKKSIDTLKSDTEQNMQELGDELGENIENLKNDTEQNLDSLTRRTDNQFYQMQQEVDTKLVATYSIKNGKPTITFSNVQEETTTAP